MTDAIVKILNNLHFSESYLRELPTKLPQSKVIRSTKYSIDPDAIDGQVLSGEYFLEIPSSNKTFYKSSAKFKELAKKYEVTIKYLDE